tara:strand:+ start:10 stop:447 length:438 start_codon:yes stop_codon:yes gene_type:complete
MPIKSFRGKIADATVDTIPLSTNNGSTGYKITKFTLMPADTDADQQITVQIFTIPQTGTPSADIDFSDNTLIAAGIYNQKGDARTYPDDKQVVFDNMIFNQDIYVTCQSLLGNAINYYIELEQISLSLDENTVATLKDIRNIASQ